MERALPVKSDGQYEQWEKADFPVLCEICLGDSPYVRMTKKPFAKQCNACSKPMTEFRWKAGRRGRFKVTVVCQKCSKAQNVCQCCVHDLTYGLPVAVRDAIIQKYGGQKAFVPKSELGFHQHQEKLENSGASSAGNDQLTDAAHAELMKMKAQRDAQGPDYRRNMPKHCTFTAKGEDTRGAENPYSTQPPPPEHMQGDGKGIQQSIRDRFFGVDDKQANSMLNKHEGKVQQQIEPPADQDIKTLWLGGIEESIEEQHLRSTFSEYGEIVRVHIVRNSKCAFVEFASRAQAEQAAAASQGSLTINGYNCRVSWAKKKSPDSENQSDNAANPTLVQQPPQPGSSPEAYANYQQYVWQAWNQYYAQQQAMAAAQQQGASSTASASNNSSSQGSTHATQLPPMPPMPPPPGSADASKSSGKGGPAKKSGNKEERKQATTPYYPSMDPTRVGSRVVEGS